MKIAKRRSRRNLVLTAAAVLPLLATATACGSDAGSETGSGAPGTASMQAQSSAFPGKKATGTPVKIGMINMEGGTAISKPEYRVAAEAVTKYANDNLGGIGGHPIDLVVCKEKEDPATARDCANQMVEQKVAAVVGVPGGFGDTMVPIITKAGIPWISASGQSSSELTDKDSFMLTGGFPATLIAMAKYSQQQGYTKVTAYVTTLATTGTQQIAPPAFKAAGVDLNIVGVPPGTPDATPQVAAGLKGNPQGIIVVGDSTLCTSLLKAIGTVGTQADRMIIEPCIEPDAVKALGSTLDGAHVFTSSDSTSDDPEAQLVRAVIGKYAPNTDPNAVYAGYQAMLGLVRATEGLAGEPTSANIIAAIKAAKDVPIPEGHGATFTCDGTALAGLPSVCSDANIVGTVQDGKPTEFKVVQ